MLSNKICCLILSILVLIITISFLLFQVFKLVINKNSHMIKGGGNNEIIEQLYSFCDSNILDQIFEDTINKLKNDIIKNQYEMKKFNQEFNLLR